MKKLISLYLLFFLFFFHCGAVEFIKSSIPLLQNPLLVVVIMVKDEEAVIRETLEMYCKADPKGEFINYFVYDTGPDAWSPTMAKAQALFDEYQLPYVIAQEPFEDFAKSRNKALRYAEQAYPFATFLLMPDAEWYLNDVLSLLQFCCQHIFDEHITKSLIRILSPGLDFYVPRLVRAHRNVCFEGVVHEVVGEDGQGSNLIPGQVYFTYPEAPQGLEKSKKRWYRDRDLLLAEYQKNPKDARTVFYLAQTYDCLNDLDNAYHYYIKRTQLSGFVEEDYMAHYRLGLLSERMAKAGKCDWNCPLQHYLNAYLMRSCRMEPLIRIAVYYINLNMYDLAFLYSYIACQAPYPTDVLFVEKELYEQIRYETFAKAGLQVGLEIPERLCKQALCTNQQRVPLEKLILSQALGVV